MKKYISIILILGIVACKKDKLDSTAKACFDYSPNTEIKIEDTLIFSNCSENSTKFNWDFGDGQNSLEKTPKHSYERIGNYKVKLAVSNDNSTDTSSKTITINPKTDKIRYYNFGDGISISSVKSFSSFGDCPSIPIPKDSACSENIDIDGDFKDDFLFESHHFQCGNTHCLFFTYSIEMDCLNNEDSIRVDKQYTYLAEKIDSTVDISKNGLWMKKIQLYLYSSCPLPFKVSFIDTYVGIRIRNNYGWIHIAPWGGNGVNILEYAINLTEYNSIRIGQKN